MTETRAPEASGATTVRGPLPQEEFEAIFSRVPRLTVELVIASSERGVLLQLRARDPCSGTWSLPGGTVRFAEPAMQAVQRVARDELGASVTVGDLLGYIEYPSHYENGLDSPVGLAFATTLLDPQRTPRGCRWFTRFPDAMHDEQKLFLAQALDLPR